MYYNVTDYGLSGDGTTSNLEPLRALLSSITDGATIYFPAGVYADILDIRLDNRANLTFCGDGAASVLRRRPTASGDMLHFHGCNDITFYGLSFDMRSISQFGGLVCKDGQRWRVSRCRFFDSTPLPIGNKDRRAVHFFTETGAGNSDIWVTDCLIEGLQLDVHCSRRVQIQNNTLRQGVVTGGLTIVSGISGAIAEDYHISGNLIDSPIGSGIAVLLDPFSNSNCAFRRIAITNNTIVMGPQTKRGIYVGTTNNSQPSAGNVFEDMTIVDNTIVCTHPAARDAYIFGNNSATANIVMDGWRVANNRIRGNGTGAGIDLRRQTQSLVTNNHVTGAT